MTNRNRFFINGIILTLVGLALRTVGLLFGAYISRAVGAEGVGLHSLIMTVYGFAVTFATSGISLTVTKLVAEAVGEGGEENGGKVLRGAIIYSLLFGSVATVLLFLLADTVGYSVLTGADSAVSLRILSLSLIPTALSSVIAGYFVGVKRVSCNAAVQVLGQFFKIAFTVFLLSRISALGTFGAVNALCIGTTVTECLCFLIALLEFAVDRARVRREKGRGGVTLGPVFSMALPLAVSAYIRSALLALEHSLIPKRLRDRGESVSESLASYGTLHGMALPLILYPLAPLSSFAGLLVPEFAETEARGDRVRMERIATEAVNTTLIYSAAVAVFVYLFSEELGYVVYDSYDAGFFIALLAPVVPIMYLDHVADSILKGIGEHVYSMWVNIADAFISVILVYILIPIFGIGGYAIVIIGMEAFNFLLSVIRLKKRIKFKISPIRSVFIPLVSATFAAFLSKILFISGGSSTTPLLLAAKMIFALCTFFAARVALTAIFNRALTLGSKPLPR